MKFFVFVIAISFSLLNAMQASAQQARSFEQLQVLVKPGDNVYLTDLSGKVSRGRITGLSGSSLQLMANGTTREFTESEVFQIRQWRQDSLRNGALIGAGAGLGLSVTFVAAACSGSDECSGGWAAAGIMVYTGLGAAVGAGIDALIPHKRTIYVGGRQATPGKIKLQPIFNRSHRGVSVAFSF